MRRTSRWGVVSAFLFASGSAVVSASAQEGPSITLTEVLALAREGNPRLQASLHEADAVRSREAEAGLLPDPSLRIGVSNLALPEFSTTMPSSMAPTVQAAQRIPLAGRRALQEEIARTSTVMAEANAAEVWWVVRTETAETFYELYRIDRRTQALQQNLELLSDLETTALSMYSAGSGPQADVLRARVARARTDADLERMRALWTGSVSRMNALLNRPIDTTIPLPELPPLPSQLPAPEVLTEWASETRPVVQSHQWAISRAESNQALAGTAVWPDLTVGIQYGLGRMDGDPRSMGGAFLGFSVPVYAGKRQRKIEEQAAARTRVARARLADAVAEVAREVGRWLAEAQGGRTLIRLYQTEILPQARAAVESSLASYRVGTIDFAALLDAQVEVHRLEGEYFDILASYGTALANLEKTIGRVLPMEGNPISEVR